MRTVTTRIDVSFFGGVTECLLFPTYRSFRNSSFWKHARYVCDGAEGLHSGLTCYRIYESLGDYCAIDMEGEDE